MDQITNEILTRLLITLQIALLVLVFRNPKVSKERIRVLDLIHKLSQEDISAGKNFKWRYEEFSEVNYFVMVFSFWKPVKSFYKNRDCLKKDI